MISEKKRIKLVDANSFVYQRRKIEQRLDDGYPIEIPEQDRWHSSHKGQDYLISKLNSTCIGTLNKSFKDLRKPLPGKSGMRYTDSPKKADEADHDQSLLPLNEYIP